MNISPLNLSLWLLKGFVEQFSGLFPRGWMYLVYLTKNLLKGTPLRNIQNSNLDIFQENWLNLGLPLKLNQNKIFEIFHFFLFLTFEYYQNNLILIEFFFLNLF